MAARLLERAAFRVGCHQCGKHKPIDGKEICCEMDSAITADPVPVPS